MLIYCVCQKEHTNRIKDTVQEHMVSGLGSPQKLAALF